MDYRPLTFRALKPKLWPAATNATAKSKLQNVYVFEDFVQGIDSQGVLNDDK